MGMIIVLDFLVRPKRQAVFSLDIQSLYIGVIKIQCHFFGGSVGGWGGSGLALLSGSLLFSLGS